MSRGRAFVLCTSYQAMKQLHDRVAFDILYPTLLQGTGPRSALLEEFRQTKNCVLFATSSFWQGVDVQGEQLSCVIIDKLPFAVPSDPVVSARTDALKKAGGDPFREYQIPRPPSPSNRASAASSAAAPTAACSPCSTTASRGNATARSSSTACPTTRSPPASKT